MTAFVRRTTILDASRGAVEPGQCMRWSFLGSHERKGFERRCKGADGQRAADLLDRDFTATRPDQKWVMDFTYVRCWAGWVYVAFILDVYAQRIVAWHAHTTRTVDLVLRPLQIALWERDRTGRPIEGGPAHRALRCGVSIHCKLRGARNSNLTGSPHRSGLSAMRTIMP